MTPNENKLYVVVRANISPGYQIVQSCHAVERLIRLHPEVAERHFDLGDVMVVVEVPGERSLLKLYERVQRVAPAEIFYEPDIRGHTAFAVAPSPFYNMFKDLPLAGSSR